VIIRTAKQIDVDRIVNLGNAVLQKSEIALGWNMQSVSEIVKSKNYKSIVAEDAEFNIIGFSLSRSASTYGLNGVLIEWTAASAQSVGVGAKLFIQLMKFYIRKKINIYADIRTDNVKVKSMLNRAGFIQVRSLKVNGVFLEVWGLEAGVTKLKNVI